MNDYQDVFDLNLSPTAVVRFDIDHGEKRLTVTLYQSPLLDEETEQFGPLALVCERYFYSPHSTKLSRSLLELTAIEENVE